MGCQDLLESVPGRSRVTSVSASPGSLSEGKSLKVRAALSGRSTNGKTSKSDDLSCKSLKLRSFLFDCFTSLYVESEMSC